MAIYKLTEGAVCFVRIPQIPVKYRARDNTVRDIRRELVIALRQQGYDFTWNAGSRYVTLNRFSYVWWFDFRVCSLRLIISDQVKITSLLSRRLAEYV